jgi:hypothetical protein
MDAHTTYVKIGLACGTIGITIGLFIGIIALIYAIIISILDLI